MYVKTPTAASHMATTTARDTAIPYNFLAGSYPDSAALRIALVILERAARLRSPLVSRSFGT
jgi:hypothetical protein